MVRSRPLFRLFFAVLTLVLSAFLLQGRVSAGYDSMDTQLNDVYDQYVSQHRNDPETGKGNYTPSFRFILYTPENDPSDSVRITNTTTSNKPQCSDFDEIEQWILKEDASGGQSKATDKLNVPTCKPTPGGTGFILSGLTQYGKSTRFPGYQGVVIRLHLDKNKPSVFLDAVVRASNDRLSYIGDNSSTQGNVKEANGVSLSRPSGGFSTIKQRFAPPCGVGSSEVAHVWWKDADSRAEANGGRQVTYKILEYRNGKYSDTPRSPNMTVGSYTGDAGSGGAFQHRAFKPKKGAKYEIIFDGVRSRSSSVSANTIKIWSPYDSAASYVDCPPPEGDIGVCGATVHFSIPNPSNGVRVRVYALNSDGSAPSTPVYNKIHKETKQIDIDKDVGLDKLNSNQGWWVLVKPANSSGDPTGPNAENPSNGQRDWKSGPCFNVSCSVEILGNIPGDGALGRVMAGSSATARMHLKNNGSNTVPSSLGGSSQLGVNSDIGFGAMGALEPGATEYTELDFTAPGGIGSHGLNAYPDMHYKFGLGPACPTTYQTFQPFDTEGKPTISLSTIDGLPDPEDPTRVTATAKIDRRGGQTNAPIVNADLRITRNGTTVGTPTNQTGSPWQWAGNVTVPQSQHDVPGGVRSLGWNVGDRICARLEYAFKSGWLGPGNNVAAGVGSGPLEDCNIIANRPYVSVYGGDVSAGGGFGDACSSSGANIDAYYKAAGSGTQLAAYAGGGISGFKSAMLRGPTNPAAQAPNGLSFGNTPGLGSYQPANVCSPNYYDDEQFEGAANKTVDNISRTTAINVNTLADNKQTVYDGAGSNITINGGITGNSHTVFVNGNVFISGNITYANTGGGWNTISDIPYFTLIVKGNIYIAPGVTELSGKYIAQPRSATEGGHIYTCAPGTPSITTLYSTSGSAIWNSCQTKLTIYGQFIASHIHFLRSKNTISEGAPYEQAVGDNKAAELFRFSPEMYLGLPATRPKATSTSGEYESITNLPPIL